MVDIGPDVPIQLPRIVERCLSKEPADRYDATRDLVLDLQAVRDDLTAGLSESARRMRPTVSKRRSTWIVVAAALALLLAGTFYWIGSGGAGSTEVSDDMPVPESPLVAVLPFRNISAEPAQDYFAAGMTEEFEGSSRSSRACGC